MFELTRKNTNHPTYGINPFRTMEDFERNFFGFPFGGYGYSYGNGNGGSTGSEYANGTLTVGGGYTTFDVDVTLEEKE